VALCLADLEGPRRVVASVGTAHNEVVGSAAHAISREFEGQLRVAVDANVDEVGDGDGLDSGSGNAGEKGDSGVLHVDGWVGSESVEVG
jgi:hypothetical protein